MLLRRIRVVIGSAALGLGLLSFSSTLFSDATDEENGKVSIEGLRTVLSEAEAFSVTMSAPRETDDKVFFTMHLIVKKPNLIRVEHRVEAPELSTWSRTLIISDGEHLFLIRDRVIADQRSGYYQQLQAPRDYWQIFDPGIWSRAPDLHNALAMLAFYCLLHPEDPQGFFQGVEPIETTGDDGSPRQKYVVSESAGLIDGRAIPGIEPPPFPSDLVIYLKESNGAVRLDEFALISNGKEHYRSLVTTWTVPDDQGLEVFKFYDRHELERVSSLIEESQRRLRMLRLR